MPEPRYQVVHRRAADLQALPAQVRRLARLCDGIRTLRELSTAANMPAERAAVVVDRLVQLGIVSPIKNAGRRRHDTPPSVRRWLEGAAPEPPPEIALPEPAPAPAVAAPEPPAAPVEPAPARVDPAPVVAAAPPPAEAAFTAEEESFFASSIEHLVGDEDYR